MPQTPRVVIIGAGVVGVHIADELARLGWANTLVLEKGPLDLPGGSTSHAPGVVFATNGSKAQAQCASYTIEKLRGLLDAEGRGCFRQVGGLELATTPERLQELHRRAGWAASYGVRAEVVDTTEAKRLHPLIDPEMVLGGLHTPDDGLALAVKGNRLLVERTRAQGVEYRDGVTVTGIDQAGGRVSGVFIGEERVAADIVISAAGFWGPKIGAMIGLDIPLAPLAHQYAWTTPLESLAGRHAEPDGASLPALRHQDRDLYYREWGDRIGIGSYQHDPIPVDMDHLQEYSRETIGPDQMPSSLSFTPEDFAPAWRDSRALLPELRSAEIQRGFNGIFSFTPDGGALVGEASVLDGFYVAEAVWITHSAGFAQALAQRVVRGSSDIDIADADLNRFEAVERTPDFVQRTSERSFVEVYDILHPLQPRVEPRDLRTSPFAARERELGAFFLQASGWERPHWYASNATLMESLPDEWRPPDREPWAEQFSSPISAVEAWRTRTAVAMYDMTPLTRVEVTGPGAGHLLQGLTTGNVLRLPGAVIYTLLLDEAGGIRSDITVARVSEEHYQAGINNHADLVLLTRLARRQSESDPARWVHVRDITGGTACIGLWGPQAREVMAKLSTEDFSDDGLRYFRCREAVVGAVPVLALRLSYVGELGWELYCSAETALTLWDAIAAAGEEFGIIPAGRGAFNALRIEKGYRAWGTDITTEHEPRQAGLSFAVKADKEGYTGHAALAERAAGTTRTLRLLTIDDRRTIVLGREPVYSGDAVVGYVTSASYGYTVGRPLAYAWLDDALGLGDAVEIGWFDARIPATVTAEPLVDPEMTRIRG